MIIMKSPMDFFADLLEAAILYISIWIWEIKMVAKFGVNWGYRETW